MGKGAIALIAGLFLTASTARADRLAVVPLGAPGREPPQAAADQLAADLIGRGHRVIASTDAVARISVGNQGAGSDWAAEQMTGIRAARSALTRLDRSFASSMARRIGNEIARFGGGAGGGEVLVEWSLLERQLALTGSDAARARAWLDAAVAFAPSLELDPLNHPEDERDQFARRRAALPNEAPATLSVETTPAAAEVWIDGVRRCASPCSVKLPAGRHFVRASSPAHAPAMADVEIAAGASAARRLGLSAAYSGASLRAIESMIADPSRRPEGASALEPMARFLDVDHVVALVPEGGATRLFFAPPAAGRPRVGPAVPAANLSATVAEELRPIAPAPSETRPWYAKSTTWLVGGGIVAGIVAGVLIYQATTPTPTGTLTVTSP
ncbi:MAG: PEGA domain-containing protein [Polyangiaceae bacterium]